MKKLCLIMSMMFPAICLAEIQEDISSERFTTLRIHTSEHAIASARKIAWLNITGLSGGCTSGVYLNSAENNGTLSFILAAKASKSDMRIGYEPDKKTPWGDNSICALTYFDIK